MNLSTALKARMEEEQTFLFIDALSLIHRAFHAYPPLKDKEGHPRGAFYGVSRILLSLLPTLKPDYLIVAFDTQAPTFRHKEYKEYKAKRPEVKKEMVEQIPLVKEFFRTLGSCLLIKDGFEADDLIGSGIQTLLKKYPLSRFIILSGDYDLAQLIRDDQVVLNYARGSIKNAQQINEGLFVERWGFKPPFLVDYKALAGDPSDNIPGAKGIGKKTAVKLVSHFQAIERLYKSVEENEEEIIKLTSPRVVGLLKVARQEVFFSKKLAKIKTNVKLEELSKIQPIKRNNDHLIDFFNHYGFKSLIRLLENKHQDSEKKRVEKESKKLNQLSFF